MKGMRCKKTEGAKRGPKPDPSSYRWLVRGRGARQVKILIACPKGKWKGNSCSVGTRAVEVCVRKKK